MSEGLSPHDPAAGAGNRSSIPALAWAKLTTFGLIAFTGDDAQAYLQGQLSCDVNALQSGHATYGSYNTPKGRMLATFLLWHDDSGYLMQLPRSVCESTRKRLSMYILRSKVTARDVTEERTLIGVAGADSDAQLTALFQSVPNTEMTQTKTNDVAMLRLDADRFQITAENAQASVVVDALAALAAPINDAAWDATNIEAGIPYITPSTQEQFVPQMANMDLINGVSFNKGCYPGQEIVARMHYLGKLKQRMYLATVSGGEAPKAGDKLYSADTGDQATGMIVNAAPLAIGGFAVLAVIHIKSFESGAVHLNSAAGPLLAFRKLPYAVPA